MHFKFGKDDPGVEYRVKAKVADVIAILSTDMGVANRQLRRKETERNYPKNMTLNIPSALDCC